MIVQKVESTVYTPWWKYQYYTYTSSFLCIFHTGKNHCIVDPVETLLLLDTRSTTTQLKYYALRAYL